MVAAYVLITISAADPLEVVTTLRALPAVRQAYALLGPTDCIAFVECDDHAALRDALLEIRAVKGITTTDTRYVYA